ncbi:sigma-54-dependent Fis family transcriptional regulator [Xylophilus sp. ASV27]|uniref:sigma-54-dependent Fis family transcriptional regulator n=1 Tax=Xylophilus sp. ASV27 TaxID=2795129 RepID=UPI0018EACF46|nr:sigma-54-dependent Fis family transcriptional regulator [Xylophilus sp. ASV27]
MPADFSPIPTAGQDVIALSHQRSQAFGLRQQDAPDATPLPSSALADLLESNRDLFAHARPVMETLHSQIAGTRSMVLLTDSEGAILHALGDDDFLARAQRVALRPGGLWSERYRGTNAIGTALVEGAATQVHAEQHYLRANHFLSCTCAPILDPMGQVVGALDVSSDHRDCHPHTLALVRMSAQMVENHFFGTRFAHALRVHFHAQPGFLGTLMEGIAAFAPDGRLLSANRSARFQFGALSLRALQEQSCGALFGVAPQALRDAALGQPGQVLPLYLSHGVKVMARVEMQAPPLQVTVEAPPRRGAVTQHKPAPVALSGLRYLATGDPQVARVLDRVGKVLGRDVPVLILGETGTGKELLARAIHHDSPRRAAPFVAVNCAAIPETLIESELFGHEDGAFTGARRKGRAGLVQQAHGGTLFLDEIGDMPLPMQARLLRVLQERLVTPLGGSQPVPVDVAVVCATHCNLREMMAAGRFREDLYYRLNGLAVRLPPLRERTDLEVIMQRLLLAAAEGGAVPALDAEVRRLLLRCRWPGNLRQMAGVLRTALLLADGEALIRRSHLPEDFLEALDAAAPDGAAAPPAGLRERASDAVQQALAAHGGNVSAAARALGVSRNTIYRHLQRR